jgi:hypothetical protein
MRGPFVLTKYNVDMVVPHNRLGVFALSNAKDAFAVLHRSEKSACDEIKAFFNQYKFFWIRPASSARDAFSIECEVYHSRMAQHCADNGNHPKAPPDSGWHCPVCGK